VRAITAEFAELPWIYFEAPEKARWRATESVAADPETISKRLVLRCESTP
jgi:hypothetical protein